MRKPSRTPDELAGIPCRLYRITAKLSEIARRTVEKPGIFTRFRKTFRGRKRPLFGLRERSSGYRKSLLMPRESLVEIEESRLKYPGSALPGYVSIRFLTAKALRKEGREKNRKKDKEKERER
uniref:Uncharacterized protein n=1 Tax=Candidatus Kentrum sp. MB TaxID=2138164 RepID=A0A450XJK1_9GAMM|nr:MAG: hypothetical protein BECKMB1821I_GA0114274_101028 [Candidatus Kentron sp. MB]VFK74802.1 MAG: hypothetical protein BECKMB1821H_GA0114242_101028 [Candidatus Kentron sp. MB]